MGQLQFIVQEAVFATEQCSVLPHFSPTCPFISKRVKRHMALTESNFPTALCGSLSGVTLSYMNKGSNFPRSQSRENHMKQKINKWCPFAFIFALFVGATIMKYHRLGGLWPADVFFFSQFWRLDVWGLCASMVRWRLLPSRRQSPVSSREKGLF